MAKLTIEKVLRNTRELIGNPDSWVKEDEALDGNGDSCDSKDKDACAWCLVGAIDKCSKTLKRFLSVMNFVHDPKHREPVMFNDHDNTTHDDVIAYLDKYITRAKQRGI